MNTEGKTCCPAFLHRLLLSRKWAYVIENEPVKRFCIFFPLWLWQRVSFKMWPFHTHKEHIKHTLCSRKVLTEVRFMCKGLDFQIEADAVTKVFLIYTASVLAWLCDWLKLGDGVGFKWSKQIWNFIEFTLRVFTPTCFFKAMQCSSPGASSLPPL